MLRNVGHSFYVSRQREPKWEDFFGRLTMTITNKASTYLSAFNSYFSFCCVMWLNEPSRIQKNLLVIFTCRYFPFSYKKKNIQMPFPLPIFSKIVQLILVKWIKNLFIFILEQNEREGKIFSFHFSTRLNTLKPSLKSCCEKAFFFFLAIWFERKVIEIEFGLEIYQVFEKPQKTPQPMYTNTHTKLWSFNHISDQQWRETEKEKGIFFEIDIVALETCQASEGVRQVYVTHWLHWYKKRKKNDGRW